MAKRIGILTGGGDCPGLNAIIRALTRRSLQHGNETIGVLEGWRGMLEGRFRPLDREDLHGILNRGGTILKSSGASPYRVEGGVDAVIRHFEGLDALIAVGGEHTISVAARMYREHGLPIIGVPKTIDNDLTGTDQTVGFDTAVSIATEAIDRLHSTAESHNRVMVVEVMGRDAGWIATCAGIAGGADVVLIPEHPMRLERILEVLRLRHARGHDFSIVVVSEGWPFMREDGSTVEDGDPPRFDENGVRRLAGVGERLGRVIERETGFQCRVTTLGHLQRGGTPTAYDRVLGTRTGVLAADLANEGSFGMLVALRGTEIVGVPMTEEMSRLGTRGVPAELYGIAAAFML